MVLLGELALMPAGISAQTPRNERSSTAFDTAGVSHLFDRGHDHINSDPDSALYLYRQVLVYADRMRRSVRDEDMPLLLNTEAHALNAIGSVLGRSGAMDSAITLHRKGLSIGLRLEDSVVVALSLNHLGLCFFNKGVMDSAETYWERALAIRERAEDKRPMANTLINIGWLHRNKGDHGQALRFFERAANIHRSTGNDGGLAYALHAMGGIAYQRGGLLRALEYHRESLGIRERMGDERGMATGHNEIALILSDLDELESAIDHLMRSKRIDEKLKDDLALGTIHVNLASIHEKRNDPERALAHLDSALTIHEQTGNATGQSLALSNTAEILLELGRIREAEDAARRGLGIAEMVGNRERIAHAGHALGNILLSKRDYLGAEPMLTDAFRAATGTGAVAQAAEIADDLGQLYQDQGRPQLAYTMRLRAMALHDSVLSIGTSRSIVRMEEEIAQTKVLVRDSLVMANLMKGVFNRYISATVDSTVSRRVLLLVALFVLVLLGGGATAALIDRKRRQAREAQRTVYLQNQVWRAQVNPRFVRTALESIAVHVQGNELEAASAFIARFARLMRAVLQNARKDEVSLADDLAVLHDYLELERVRLGGTFSWSVYVDPALNIEEVSLAPMLVQPFAQEAIWRGSGGEGRVQHLSVSVRASDDVLLVSLEDDGGHQPMDVPGTGVNAIWIARQRIAALTSEQDPDAGVRVMERPQGRRVELRIPLLAAA